MNSDRNIVLYFLSLHVSGVGRHVHITDHARHLNECSDAVVGDTAMSENMYGSAGEIVVDVDSHIWCHHGWGTQFEASYSGTIDGFRAAADTLITS